jgi:hypothetical protein
MDRFRPAAGCNAALLLVAAAGGAWFAARRTAASRRDGGRRALDAASASRACLMASLTAFGSGYPPDRLSDDETRSPSRPARSARWR